MMRRTAALMLFLGMMMLATDAQTANNASVVVLYEPQFPAADTVAPTEAQIHNLFANAHFVNATELPAQLESIETKLLVLPFGSAFPEEDWTSIFSFLSRGGNLLVLGGKPFTRAAYRDNNEWKLRAESLAFARLLLIHDYQETPGSPKLQFLSNGFLVHPDISGFARHRAFSATIQLSSQ